MSLLAILAWIKGVIGGIRYAKQITYAAASSGIVFIAARYSELLSFREKLQAAWANVQSWFGFADSYSTDWGLTYRLANWLFPMDLLFSILSVLVGLVILVQGINVAIWLIGLSRSLLVSDEEDA